MLVFSASWLGWKAVLSLIRFCLLGIIFVSVSLTGSILLQGVKSSFGLNLSSNPFAPVQILEDCLGV